MTCDEDRNHDNSSEDETQDSTKRWEWRFYLLVEDGGATQGADADEDKPNIKVLVHHHDAEHLLKLDAEEYVPLKQKSNHLFLTMHHDSLRKNPTALAQLREKLFILWGDLEERKSAGLLQSTDLDTAQQHQHHPPPQTKPFECCLMQYGVRVHFSAAENPGDLLVDHDDMVWERRFKMFGTTIM